jgi:hypothetical protein
MFWDEGTYLAAWQAQVAAGLSLYPWLYGTQVEFPDYEMAEKKRRWAEMGRIRKALKRAELRAGRGQG